MCRCRHDASQLPHGRDGSRPTEFLDNGASSGAPFDRGVSPSPTTGVPRSRVE